ncbi:hypothetical protein GCM10011575_32690 [Microlunatus endophyticus]|uniref:Uncharacterized protein n=1 Tax=Microlunatus endophyticus TaxID=1716077 RepID=A0A917SEM6_9ACTN|nr:hypothetical protein [Microlunatus endophyticus]GGL71832.1 hypothetical protein GCM10011575_32690 [Microlunatus endophyticus]
MTSAVRTGKPARTGNRRAAWLLVVLTPLIAELALGSTPVSYGFLVLLWIPVYGSLALLIRELVMRAGRGWPSLIMLAVGYELLEDGIGLQALTSPHLYGAAEWGARILGFNLPYWVANAIYHAIFTIAVPITVVNLIFPGHRGRPYLKRGGVVIAAVVGGIGVLILRVTVPLSQDPGYQAPLPFVIAVLVIVGLLGVVALRILPRVRTRVAEEIAVPGLGMLYPASALAIMIVMFLAFPAPGATQPAYTHGLVVLVPLVLAVAGGVAGCLVLARYTRSSAWTARHTLAVAGGASIGHTVAGAVAMASQWVDRIGLFVIALLTVVGIIWLDRRILRSSGESPESDR